MTDHAFELCQRLLRIDTTNPPGNERPAADLLATELRAAGLEPVVLESAPGRANVVARLRGTGELPPLLLTAHLDVVEADAEQWQHPPFSGVVADGCLWGRGAIDMKNMAAMSVAVICRLAREGAPLRRDLVFAGVADEEAGCDHGSGFLCDHHRELVAAEYALGEGGGFNIWLGGRPVVTIQVAEKGTCWLTARARGEPGHGSLPRDDSAVLRLSGALARLRGRRLPAHGTAAMRAFASAVGAALPGPLRALAPLLLHPRVAPALLERLAPPAIGRPLLASLSNTASPTVLRAGGKTNVIPGLAEATIDGRVLPGQTTESFLRELRAVLGEEVELEVLRESPPVVTEPMFTPLYRTITEVLADRWPEAVVVPYLLPGFTDARSFTRIGAKWVGFAPVRLPPGMRFADMFHGHDERVPVDGLRWGTEVLHDVVRRVS